MGIGRPAQLSPTQGAIAPAVVSTKDHAHFWTTPGGYFHGMVAKAKAGEATHRYAACSERGVCGRAA
jgi:hypothetical protein